MNEKEHPDCARFRDHFPAALYGELDPGTQTGLSRHLEVCPVCRQAYRSLEQVGSCLDRWPAPEERSESRALAAAVVAQAAAQQRRGRRRAILFRAAAAVIALATLCFFAAEARYADGELTLRLRAPWLSPAAEADAQLGRTDVREIARDVLEAEVASLGRSQAQELSALSRREREERLRLLQALDHVRSQDRQAVAAALDTITRTASAEDRRLREALFDLASVVVDGRTP